MLSYVTRNENAKRNWKGRHPESARYFLRREVGGGRRRRLETGESVEKCWGNVQPRVLTVAQLHHVGVIGPRDDRQDENHW